MKKIVLIPTYNEKENVSAILHAVLGLSSDYHVLIIDDNSPDGTAAIVEGLMGKFLDRLFILKRPGKQGLGTAYIQGFKWALDNNYDYIFEMDADFSHNPIDLDRLLATCEENGADVSIGSRYVKGGETENWPLDRKIYSLGGSAYTRIITGMPIKDPTAGFICYKNKVLADINLDTIQFIGYAFQIEMKFAAWKLGYKIKEVPITFVDRKLGLVKCPKELLKKPC